MVTQTHFTEYCGTGDGIIHGKGGTRRVLDGVDIWENGEPNRNFRILGTINDDVMENNGAEPGTLNVLSVASAFSLQGREKRLVAEAKKRGADAIIYASTNRSFLNATQYQTNFRNQVMIVAVQYTK
jgi:hypothetical protein